MHWARQGAHEAVLREVGAIREAFGKRPNAEVTAWISLAEAVNSFYSQPGLLVAARFGSRRAGAGARDRPRGAAGAERRVARAPGVQRQPDGADDRARGRGAAARRPSSTTPLARASLVVADAYHYAGRFDLAKGWYAAVRQHALADGDDAMISAMLHNVATFRANNVWMSSRLVR